MENIQFKVQNVFGDGISKDNFSQEQLTKINSFFGQKNVNINFCRKINLYKPKKNKNIDIGPSAPAYYE